MAIKMFNLPDPGEGLVEAEIVEWKVAPGDSVKVNDVVLEIETAKSLVELPIPWAGTVAQLLVEVGQTIDVGTPIISIDDGLGGDDAPAAAPSIPGERAQPADGRGRHPRRLRRQGRRHGASGPQGSLRGRYAVRPGRLARPLRAGPGPVAPAPAPRRGPRSRGAGPRCRHQRPSVAVSRRWHRRAPQGEAARAQARQGPRHRPRGGHADRGRRRHHPRRRQRPPRGLPLRRKRIQR